GPGDLSRLGHRIEGSQVEVVEAALESPVLLHVGDGAKLTSEPVVGALHRDRAGPQRWLVSRQPQYRRGDGLLRQDRTGQSQEVQVLESALELTYFVGGARVVLEYRASQWDAVAVTDHHGGYHARDRQRRHIGVGGARVDQEASNDLARRRPPFSRVSLRPAGEVAEEGHLTRGARHDAVLGTDEGALDA